tara:strand:+ start:100 stop:243 length:144 start_codon:yes stop_codon:yes gene_type:complete
MVLLNSVARPYSFINRKLQSFQAVKFDGVNWNLVVVYSERIDAEATK